MIKYEFEYINQKFTSKLVLALFALFLILFIGSIFLSVSLLIKGSFVVIFCFIFSASIPYLIYRSNREKIKREGSAIIFESHVQFNLYDKEEHIKYTDIESYLIQNYNGTLLNLVLKNGKKFNAAANNTYCDTTKFDNFCQEFENTLQNYSDNSNSRILRKKNFFEKAWVFPFLVIFTSIFLSFILYALFTGKNFRTSSFLMAIGSLLPLWAGYLSTKKKK